MWGKRYEKKVLIFLIGLLLFIPDYIEAGILTEFDKGIGYREKYIENIRKNTKLFHNVSGEFLSETDYYIAGGFNSYLYDAQDYWVNTNDGGKSISSNTKTLENTISSGIRVVGSL